MGTASLVTAFIGMLPLAADSLSYRQRVDLVRKTPGFVALWDFVNRDEKTGVGRFAAHQRPREKADLRLDAANYVRDYWNEGRPATYSDFKLRGKGPFGEAVYFAPQKNNDFRPLLLVPRERLHGSGIDVKGPGKSVSLVAWIRREGSGNHAIAGIWHEGTDLHSISSNVSRVEKGKRQYALFMGLAANTGASAAHVSENGGASFGDKYARNLSTTPDLIPAEQWSTVALVFNNAANTVTSYLNGRAADFWIEHPEKHPFFQWVAKGWLQAQLHRMPGMQRGEDPDFPRDQFYEPPEGKPLARELQEVRPDGGCVELLRYRFTKVRVTSGRGGKALSRELVALRANPLWFAHDLYHPTTPADGGPFTIGEVIHTSRSQGFTGYMGGVAVFDRALSAKEMLRLASLTQMPELP